MFSDWLEEEIFITKTLGVTWVNAAIKKAGETFDVQIFSKGNKEVGKALKLILHISLYFLPTSLIPLFLWYLQEKK